MTILLNCQALSKAFHSRLLFRDLSLSIFSQDRIGLTGPNGSGKSTLLKILAGVEKADAGTVSAKRGIRIGYVAQSCDFPDISPLAVLIDTLKEEQMPDYEKERLAETELSRFGFTEEHRSAAQLSGGWKKRLSMAAALIQSPDLLLLDEPTNHLDLEGILWLERFLLKEAPSYLIVSHDRYFLQNVTNRIVEIDPAYPKGVFSIEGPYSFFLEKKQQFLEGQLEQQRSLAGKLRKETEWLRTSPKARTTKSTARIDAAHEMIEEFSALQSRNKERRSEVSFVASERETRKLLVAKNIAKEAGGRMLFRHLDFTLSPGTRIGLMGPNGSGKTTLLKLIAGELSPDQGSLKPAENLKIVYFDQHRVKLKEGITLREALSPTGDYVNFQGRPIHVNGWCKRFLFSPDLLDMSISRLSGGERARIAIAHLMLQPADLLLLDEPTNDLDIATLEALEESLLDFPGAVVLITHDRYMLDRLCNLFLALGETTGIYADYKQWEMAALPSPSEKKKEEKKKSPGGQKKEAERIERKIHAVEAKIQELNALLEKEESPLRLNEICAQVGIAEKELEALYIEWERLI